MGLPVRADKDIVIYLPGEFVEAQRDTDMPRSIRDLGGMPEIVNDRIVCRRYEQSPIMIPLAEKMATCLKLVDRLMDCRWTDSKKARGHSLWPANSWWALQDLNL